MATKLAELRARRDAKAKEANAINDKYPGDTLMPKADIEKMTALLDEVESIDDQIKVVQRAAEKLAEDPEALRDEFTREPSKHDNQEESAAVRAFLTGGVGALNADQRSRMRGRQTPEIRGAMSTTTDSEGGYTVMTEYMRKLEEALKAFGGMRDSASVIQTASGAPINWPTADATAETGEIVGQNAAVTAADTTFGNLMLEVFKYSSKKIALPFELVQDSFLDIEAYIRKVLTIRLGRIGNTHFTTGSGSNQPWGVVTSAASGKVGTTGQTTTVIYNDLVDLEHSVDPAYRTLPGVGFMMNDSTLKVLRKIVDGQSRPIFVPGYETGNPGGAPDRLLNRRIIINQDMATMAANAKSILFGPFSNYVIRDVMDLTLFRMTDSAFTLNGQIGFVAFQRMGGRLIDLSGASVRYYQNSAS